MAFSNCAVLAILGFIVPVCGASSAQVGSGGSLVRSEQQTHEDGPIKVHVPSRMKPEEPKPFPLWAKYFMNNNGHIFNHTGGLRNVTFVKIGDEETTKGDPIYDSAKLHGWRGISVEPEPTNFVGAKRKWSNVNLLGKKIGAVSSVQFKMSDKDDEITHYENKGKDLEDEEVKLDVKSMSLGSLWSQHASKLGKVDILTLDAVHAKQLMMHGQLTHPLPRFILYGYKGIKFPDLKKMNNNLENQGYKYIERNGELELHEYYADLPKKPKFAAKQAAKRAAKAEKKMAQKAPTGVGKGPAAAKKLAQKVKVNTKKL